MIFNSYFKFATAQNANQQIRSHLSIALNKGFVCRNSPPPSHIIEVDKNKQKHHPQIWCGKGQTEPTVSKHVYNYAQRKSSSEKTPMCRVAELTRYNKVISYICNYFLFPKNLILMFNYFVSFVMDMFYLMKVGQLIRKNLLLSLFFALVKNLKVVDHR
jgi:hypothetical protein